MKARILVGDALETLKTLPDNSVDAIVTDPPYGLSDSSQASPARVAAEFMLPDDAHFVVEGSGACVLAAFMRKIVQLHPVRIQPGETPAVPVAAVALDDQASDGQHDIEHATGAPNACADIEPQTMQYLGYLAFKAADASTLADMVSRSGGELQTGSLRIGLGVGSAGLPGLLSSCQVIDDGDPNVGAFNDALAVCIRAAARAKDFAVPALALSGAAQHDLSASAALVLLGVAKLGGAQLVRAKPRARGLTTKLQALRIRVIVPGADRALSFDLLVHPRGVARGGFMGKDWDSFTPGSEYWRECLRVAKPGAHIVAFSGTRTGHRLACAIEDAGWELRDCLMWLYGSGFPKSHDVSKAIDKEVGAERQVIGQRRYADGTAGHQSTTTGTSNNPTTVAGPKMDTAPATPAAQQWQGWGTALKPAWEPIYLARKPLVGTVASNVLEYGCGGLNVDGCRIGETSDGRWPANLCLDEHAAAALDEQTQDKLHGAGKARSGAAQPRTEKHDVTSYQGTMSTENMHRFGDSGGASRFFYVAKASRSEREKGLEAFGTSNVNDGRETSIDNPYQRCDTQRRNTHPTVKPIALMQWLIKLITPPGGIVLDPFNGSGSTGCAAVSLGHRYIGCELNPEYVDISMARMRAWAK